MPRRRWLQPRFPLHGPQLGIWQPGRRRPDINATVSGLVALIQSLAETDEIADSAEPGGDAALQAESAEDYVADNSSEDVADAAAADAVEAEVADAERTTPSRRHRRSRRCRREAIADELAEAAAVEDATDDSEVTDVPDDWNMINVPGSGARKQPRLAVPSCHGRR